jgi:hypothetical protein
MIDSLKVLIEEFDRSYMNAVEAPGIKCKCAGFLVFENFHGVFCTRMGSFILKRIRMHEERKNDDLSFGRSKRKRINKNFGLYFKGIYIFLFDLLLFFR